MADSKAEYPAPDCLAPAAIEAKTETAGVTKANLPVAKAFLLAMFAGAFHRLRRPVLYRVLER